MPASARMVTTGTDADRIQVALIGTAGPVVLLSNQSDADLCSWLPFATTLTATGYRVAVWDYTGTAPVPQQVVRVVTALRAGGATRIVLMGASKGAKASLVAATMIEPPVAGVVALSAEAVLAPAIAVAGAASHLHTPVLLVTATQDGYGAATAAPAIMRAIPGADKRLVTTPGTAHGVDLLTGDTAATTIPAVTAFLKRVRNSPA